MSRTRDKPTLITSTKNNCHECTNQQNTNTNHTDLFPDNFFACHHHQVGIGSLYAADAASSLCASFLVSPFITIVDRSIMQNASGAMKMGDSIRYDTAIRQKVT